MPVTADVVAKSLVGRPERNGYGSTVFINITLYEDHSDRLKYRSLPVDQGWRNGA